MPDTPENTHFDPNNPEHITQRFNRIFDDAPEAELVVKAGGDTAYLDLLRQQAVAALGTEIRPDDEDTAQQLAAANEELQTYETDVLGITPQALGRSALTGATSEEEEQPSRKRRGRRRGPEPPIEHNPKRRAEYIQLIEELAAARASLGTLQASPQRHIVEEEVSELEGKLRRFVDKWGEYDLSTLRAYDEAVAASEMHDRKKEAESAENAPVPMMHPVTALRYEELLNAQASLKDAETAKQTAESKDDRRAAELWISAAKQQVDRALRIFEETREQFPDDMV